MRYRLDMEEESSLTLTNHPEIRMRTAVKIKSVDLLQVSNLVETTMIRTICDNHVEFPMLKIHSKYHTISLLEN